MKAIKSLIAAVGMILCGSVLAAGPLTENFVADNGQVFQIRNVVSVKKINGYVVVRGYNATDYDFPDATGAVWTKVVTSPGFTQHYVQVPTDPNRYINTTADITQILCSGTQTAIAWVMPNQPEYFADGCQLWQAIKGASQ